MIDCGYFTRACIDMTVVWEGREIVSDHVKQDWTDEAYKTDITYITLR